MIISAISKETGLPIQYLERLARTASYRYKNYRIRKRTKGYRNISHPARELKLVQNWIAENIFSELPVHKAVHSYRRGKGIRQHALIHADSNYLLRVDFKDFFPSISKQDVAMFLLEYEMIGDYKISKQDVTFIANCISKDNALTIGAPSSPSISNAILFEFDERLSKICRSAKVKYSRYADDLYFSTNRPNVLEGILEEVKQVITVIEYPKLRINHAKSVFTSKKRQRIVTGLILTSDQRISVGRNQKRYIRSLIHRYSIEDLSAKEASYLRGYLAYVESVEPTFIVRLESKYGSDVLRQIRSASLVRRKH